MFFFCIRLHSNPLQASYPSSRLSQGLSFSWSPGPSCTPQSSLLCQAPVSHPCAASPPGSEGRRKEWGT